MLTGNGSPESDLLAQTNGGVLELKAVNNAIGGDIQFFKIQRSVPGRRQSGDA